MSITVRQEWHNKQGEVIRTKTARMSREEFTTYILHACEIAQAVKAEKQRREKLDKIAERNKAKKNSKGA